MKLSIWQQFSSNHSNGFTVVGKFDTDDDALQATNRLKTILEDIFLQGIGYSETEALQAELDLGKEFDIEWTKHLDWIYIDEYEHVQQFGNYVSISDYHGSTYQGALYIDQLVAKLAQEAYVADNRTGDVIAIVLSCNTPTVEIANTIYEEVNPYLVDVREEKGHLVTPPWRSYSKSENKEYTSLSPHDDAYYGHVRKSKQQISFDHLSFGAIGVGLPALISYLEHHGCIDIEYTISQEPMHEVYEED